MLVFTSRVFSTKRVTIVCVKLKLLSQGKTETFNIFAHSKVNLVIEVQFALAKDLNSNL